MKKKLKKIDATLEKNERVKSLESVNRAIVAKSSKAITFWLYRFSNSVS